MEQITLKKVRLDELEQVQDIYWKLLDSSKEYEKTLQWKKNIYPAKKDWTHYIMREELYFLVAEETVIGAVVLSDELSEVYKKIPWNVSCEDEEMTVIHLLAISPEYQGKGYATKSLKCIADFMKNEGKKTLRLDAISTNVHAQKIYQRFGFENCGEEKLYYESTGLADFIFYEYALK